MNAQNLSSRLFVCLAYYLREAPGLDAALQHEVTCSHRLADHVTARRGGFAARSLDPILTV
jgi:hypothetical protein